MKTFRKDGKINFVDSQNALVGFDYEAECCEEFGHYFTVTEPTFEDGEDKTQTPDTEGFVFDTSFIKKHAANGDGGEVAFRLTRPDGKEMFLTIYNHHNGYYSHGFEMFADANEIFSGII